jgi:NAD(P)-dependent dehydrogenase (short-subunit alcohol dehydrogenase family)
MASGNKVLKGKVAIITGSSTGFGEDFAKTFAKEGANVSLTGRNKQALEKVAAECKALGAEVVVTVGEITSEAVRKEIIRNTVDKFGKIDVLINNAGLGSTTPVKIEEGNIELLERILDVNLKSVYSMIAHATPHLIKSKGNIINISSVCGLRPFEGASAYSISKAGLDMLTKCAALELAPYKIRVNSANPASFLTDFFRDATEEERRARHEGFAKLHALQRMGELHELSSYVVYLASDAASFMTGTIVPIDGGAMIYTPPIGN